MKNLFVSFLFLLCFVLPSGAQKQKSSWVNGPVHDGIAITAELDAREHMKNIGGRDGAGMCVFSAIEMAARWQNLEQMRGWRDWCAKNYAGGGYPSKVDKLLQAWWDHKNIKPIPYLQYEGKAPEELLKVISKTNRMSGVTYGYSPRYGGYVAHMVNGVLYQEKYATILDNNFIGANAYEWMTPAEFIRRMRLEPNGRQGNAWAFVWLAPGAPPIPKGKK